MVVSRIGYFNEQYLKNTFKNNMMYTARDISDTLKDTYDYLAIHGKHLLGIWMLFAAPLLLLHHFLLSKLPLENVQALMDSGDFWIQLSAQNSINDMLGGLYPLVILSGVITQATSIVIILEHVKRTRASIEFGPDDIASLVPKIVLFSILYAGFSMVLGLSILFFILPFFFIGPKLCVVFQAYLLEDRSFSDSFVDSWKLTTYQFWPTIGLLLLLILFSFIYGSIVEIPNSFLLIAYDNLGIAEGALGNFFRTLSMGLFAVLSSLTTIVFQVALSFHYFNLKARNGDMIIE
jgi:hypothetical protein